MLKCISVTLRQNLTAMTRMGQGHYLGDDIDDDVMSKEVVYDKGHVDATSCNGSVIYTRPGGDTLERGRGHPAAVKSQVEIPFR